MCGLRACMNGPESTPHPPDTLQPKCHDSPMVEGTGVGHAPSNDELSCCPAGPELQCPTDPQQQPVTKVCQRRRARSRRDSESRLHQRHSEGAEHFCSDSLVQSEGRQRHSLGAARFVTDSHVQPERVSRRREVERFLTDSHVQSETRVRRPQPLSRQSTITDGNCKSESKARWERRRGLDPQELRELNLPEPLQGGRQLQGQPELPSCEVLEAWLREHGVEAADWKQHKGGKGIKDLWKEVKLEECGMELWMTKAGEVKPVRVVHVLRAKVCSPESYERDIFVFNNWQQFSDGRTRTRNGLLSEKLSVAEMPLREHLHEVCRRAVTTEEMQRVEEAAFRVGPGYARPEYDPDYVCPITVADAKYIDHSVEIVGSASYPTLLTLYHLYTVEIVCNGLPSMDFTTLEFDHPDDSGHRKLKYVHGWSWLEWSQIQRYLFEGSELKDRKVKGSFKNAEDLTSWLQQFDLELSAWGTDYWKSTEDLFLQVESGETHLEHWGRHDGVPLLMRVVHVLRLEVKSSDPRLLGKLLLLTWQQEAGGSARTVNRLMTGVVKTLDLPVTEQDLKDVAARTVEEKVGYIVDAHIRLGSITPSMQANLQHSGVQIVRATLVDHDVDVIESPSYKGMCTLYHLYDMQVECQGLPFSEFASITLGQSQPHSEMPRVRSCQGFRWVTWPACLDIWQHQVGSHLRKQEFLEKACHRQQEVLATTSETLEDLNMSLERLAGKLCSQGDDPDVSESMHLVQVLQGELAGTQHLKMDTVPTGDFAQTLPPSMVSTMSQSTIVAKEILETAALRRMRLMERLGNLGEEPEVSRQHSICSGGATPFNGNSCRHGGGVGIAPMTAPDVSTRSGSLQDASAQSSRRESEATRLQERIEEAFSAIDVKGSGTLSERALCDVIQRICPDMSGCAIQTVLAAANANKDGSVRYRDFIRWIYEDKGSPLTSCASSH
mmetsp:Transcript_36235/g.112715  ORF Transcript_36235/g.112715 Transcript_36235/m.112715 type:complete len:949 (-) Transcript_36235:38-2884(-)